MQKVTSLRQLANTLLVLGLVVPLSAATVQGYTFIKIAETGSGGFTGFNNQAPSVNAAGTVAFQSGFVGGAGIYIGAGGGTTTIADTSGPTFSSFNNLSINSAGTVAFGASRKTEAGGGQGIFAGSGGPITTIALGSESGTGELTGFAAHPSINTAGTVAFHASRNAAMGGGTAIYTGNGGPLTTIVRSSDADFAGISGTDPTINAAGTVAFVAGVAGSGNAGIFTRNGDQTIQIAENIRSAQGNGPFNGNFAVPSINSTGTVAFRLGSNPEGYGVYVASGGEPLNVPDSGNPGAPATIVDSNSPVFGSFGGFTSINASGTVAFSSGLDAGGIGIFTGPNPVTDKVIRQGDPLFGSTVSNLIFGRDGLNDAGQVAFLYFLASGRSGIALASIDEPSPLEGDYNQNGVVDAADYVVWRKGLGTTHVSGHYDVWRGNFGAIAGPGNGSAEAALSHAAVPEPATIIPVVLAILCVLAARQFRAADLLRTGR